MSFHGLIARFSLARTSVRLCTCPSLLIRSPAGGRPGGQAVPSEAATNIRSQASFCAAPTFQEQIFNGSRDPTFEVVLAPQPAVRIPCSHTLEPWDGSPRAPQARSEPRTIWISRSLFERHQQWLPALSSPRAVVFIYLRLYPACLQEDCSFSRHCVKQGN